MVKFNELNISALQFQHKKRYSLHTDSRRQLYQYSQRSHRSELAASSAKHWTQNVLQVARINKT